MARTSTSSTTSSSSLVPPLLLVISLVLSLCAYCASSLAPQDEATRRIKSMPRGFLNTDVDPVVSATLLVSVYPSIYLPRPSELALDVLVDRILILSRCDRRLITADSSTILPYTPSSTIDCSTSTTPSLTHSLDHEYTYLTHRPQPRYRQEDHQEAQASHHLQDSQWSSKEGQHRINVVRGDRGSRAEQWLASGDARRLAAAAAAAAAAAGGGTYRCRALESMKECSVVLGWHRAIVADTREDGPRIVCISEALD